MNFKSLVLYATVFSSPVVAKYLGEVFSLNISIYSFFLSSFVFLFVLPFATRKEIKSNPGKTSMGFPFKFVAFSFLIFIILGLSITLVFKGINTVFNKLPYILSNLILNIFWCFIPIFISLVMIYVANKKIKTVGTNVLDDELIKSKERS